MATARFRFHGELNDFLPPARRRCEFAHRFSGRSSIKDMIEALGVPHPEVDAILINGRAVRFPHVVRDGDRISVHPADSAPDGLHLQPRPPRCPRFVLDVHLGRLARYLRMLGFDCLYRRDAADAELAELAATSRRVLLSRDLGLLKRSLVRRGYFLRQTAPRQQVQEVIRRFGLAPAARPFHRCMACNGVTAPVAKCRVQELLPPRVAAQFRRFRRCRGCGRVYWPGSHYQRMLALVAAWV